MHFKNKVGPMAEWAASNIVIEIKCHIEFQIMVLISNKLVSKVVVNFTRAGVWLVFMERPGPNVMEGIFDVL